MIYGARLRVLNPFYNLKLFYAMPPSLLSGLGQKDLAHTCSYHPLLIILMVCAWGGGGVCFALSVLFYLLNVVPIFIALPY